MIKIVNFAHKNITLCNMHRSELCVEAKRKGSRQGEMWMKIKEMHQSCDITAVMLNRNLLGHEVKR